MLWRKHGGPLQKLPPQDNLLDGTVYTDLANNPAALAALGWTRGARPDEVPMRKIEKRLIKMARLDEVMAFINGLPEEERALAMVDWTRAPNLVTSTPLALAAKAALGYDDDEYDAFLNAALDEE